MNESSILQRLYNLERETGLVEFHYDEVLQPDPASGFSLAVLVASDLVAVDDEAKSISLTAQGRELSIDLWGVGVDLDEERGKMEEERRNTDFSEVWAEA
jgi:hypothetical protein